MCEIDSLDTNKEINSFREVKTKEYLLRAQRNYYHKHKDDAEYKEKLRLKKQKYRQDHKEEYNEKQRAYPLTVQRFLKSSFPVIRITVYSLEFYT
jgi:hypothetical protein